MKPTEELTQGKTWIQTGDVFRQLASQANVTQVLPKAVYVAKYEARQDEFFLEKLDSEFTFTSKIYGLEDKLINHILTTYDKTEQNLGILFNGQKGTGKTVCAKIIANEMNLPVILCDTPVETLAKFITQFNAPAIFFFDEFEKNFKNNTEILLSAMDGAYNTDVRKIFILTTNSLSINDNFLSRPSRIRYVKTFGNLSKETIKAYCDENLNDKTKYDELVDFIDTLTISTIDILKTIVEEINLHDCSVSEFKEFFNVATAPYQYNAILTDATSAYTVDDFKSDSDIYLKLTKQVSRYDEDDDSEADEDDDEKDESIYKNKVYKNTPQRNNLYNTRVTANYPVTTLIEGSSFYQGKVVKALNKDGIIIIEKSSPYGKPFIFIRILDVNTKPSIYSIGRPFDVG